MSIIRAISETRTMADMALFVEIDPQEARFAELPQTEAQDLT